MKKSRIKNRGSIDKKIVFGGLIENPN